MSVRKPSWRWGWAFALCLCILLAATLGVNAVSKAKLEVYVRAAGIAGGTAAETEWENQMYADFQEKHPDITLDLITPVGSAGYLEKLITLWAVGQPPDVWDHGGFVASYIEKGWLLDLAPFIQREPDLGKDFFPGAWRAYQQGGHVWGMPHVSMSSLIWYNVDLFEQAGLPLLPVDWDDPSWTWDAMVDYAKRLTRLTPDGRFERAGVSVGLGGGIESPVYSNLWGGDWFDEQTHRTGESHVSTIASPENIKAYEKVVDLIQNYGGNVAGGYAGGKVGMAVRTPLNIAATARQDAFFCRWGFAPMPAGTHRAAALYTDPWMISSQTKHPEEAWLFIKYMTSVEVMKNYTAFGFGLAPVARRSAIKGYIDRLVDASDAQNFNQILSVLSGGQVYGREVYDHTIAGWADIWRVTREEFPLMVQGTKSVQAALLQAHDAITAIISERKR